ncbi:MULTISPECIES: twin-arginine translocase subunit TatE [Pantoea]|mgnify:FL=1|uniref:Probable Sec-independent protein translocase protein TatE n=1 Tax=Pantoea anthophila TaxID=470931 RepID=A0ABY2Z6A1_9GAMM|nr:MULTISPECIES: twin-arginine translocase subunit TatE [Pantoea]KAF6662219.1 twin-arginine translocase subunit TatE [Enterobacteriaceae bacterium EKM102V]TPE18715.1 twin-arginine translocase subunit TatE [Pantoea vagans]EIB99600.1 twin arginine translocase protein E [Pantoea sp. Sc1]KAA5973540.1 twin-arginine translocase subunit TatE [Pantoea sp. M_6]KAA5980786.1 twin-arginine translocase subunit TatE [Pantoea sp. M_8]
MEGISIAKLLIIGALIVLLFGTNKLRSLGGDLGSAIKGFKKAMKDEDTSATRNTAEDVPAERVVHKD